MIRNLVFDFGRVLVDYDFGPFVANIFSQCGYAGDVCSREEQKQQENEFRSVACDPAFVDRCDKGDELFPDLISGLQHQYPHWKDHLQMFMERQLDVITGEVPGMRDLLSRYKAAGYRLYGLTNWSATLYEVVEKFDILQMMDERLVSSEEKLIKPDVAIFHRFFDKFGLKPEECVFTDDKIANVKGSLASGMAAIQFKDAVQLEKELRFIL